MCFVLWRTSGRCHDMISFRSRLSTMQTVPLQGLLMCGSQGQIPRGR